MNCKRFLSTSATARAAFSTILIWWLTCKSLYHDISDEVEMKIDDLRDIYEGMIETVDDCICFNITRPYNRLRHRINARIKKIRDGVDRFRLRIGTPIVNLSMSIMAIGLRISNQYAVFTVISKKKSANFNHFVIGYPGSPLGLILRVLKVQKAETHNSPSSIFEAMGVSPSRAGGMSMCHECDEFTCSSHPFNIM